METLYKPLEHKVTENPIFVIGTCPGKTKDKEKIVFKGNRTGDFVQKWIKDKENIYLTNVFNKWIDYTPDEEIIKEGLVKLEEDIERLNPSKVFLLGAFAFKHCSGLMKRYKLNNHNFLHPSYILRFCGDHQEYINILNEYYESN